MTAETTVRVHRVMAGLWFALAIATTGWAIYDPENRYLLAWLVFMSGYANVAAHLSGAAGAGPSEGDNDA